jgi:hypothetical protein
MWEQDWELHNAALRNILFTKGIQIKKNEVGHVAGMERVKNV